MKRFGMAVLNLVVFITLPVWGGFALAAACVYELRRANTARKVITGRIFILKA